MRILYITPRFPYPPLRGDQVRSYNQLRILGRRHDITLVAIADKRVTPAALRHMESFCESVIVEPLTAPKAIAGLSRLLVGDPRPVQTLLYRPSGRPPVRRLIAGHRFDLVHAQLVRTAGVVPWDAGVPVVLDLVDALSAGYYRRLEAERNWWRRSALAFEARRLAGYERDLLKSGARCLVVSERDRAALGPGASAVVVNPNGVDLQAYPFSPGRGISGRVMFTGNLGYAPNVDGICWFAREILPAIRAAVPYIELWIAGARATRRVRRLRHEGGVTLLGEVASVYAALRDACVAVAPVRTGTGIQNKVLEAMATGVPVVATSLAVSGMDVRADEHCLVADTPRDFARAVELLLRRTDVRARLAMAARALVARRYSWEASIGQLERVYLAALGVTTTLSSGELSLRSGEV